MEIVKNVSDEELLMIYNFSDLFVLPSIVDSQGNTEGLGVVLLEAMACGLPVIASDVGGISDIIQNGETGILVNEKDVSGLVEAITLFVDEKNFKNFLILNGSKKIRNHFDWKIISRRHIECYEKLKKH